MQQEIKMHKKTGVRCSVHKTTRMSGCGSMCPKFLLLSREEVAIDRYSLKNFFRSYGMLRSAIIRSIGISVAVLIFSSCQQPTPATQPGLHVPDGFVVEQAVTPGLVKYPMFATLDNKGRLFVAESSGHTTSTEDVLANPTFFIRLLEDTDGDGIYDKSVVFADSIPYPMGGTFYRGSFYTAAPPHLLRLKDTNGDGIADEREVILTGWVLSHNAATLSGPFFGPDGWMYLCDARRGFDITTKEGKRLQGKGARIWRCRPDGTGLEAVAGGGFDNTIEMTFMPSGETIGTMTYFTDPRDGMRDAIMHWVEGGVYPKDHVTITDDNLQMTGDLMPVMTKLARVSHAGIMRYRSSGFGNDFQGDLFTAEFNTGRLMRHTITPDGATFQTQTEPFLTSSLPDFHPTDVLEDADGSILFVNTGGWFIAGCPLSVVAKADVLGNIFRIRKTRSEPIADPWGHRMDMPALSPEKLTDLMADTRIVVRENAIEELVLRADAAVPSLDKLLTTATDYEIRIAAVFALYRIGGAQPMARVVKALDDRHVSVRVAAARACGLSRESSAVDELVRMVAHDEAPARRQAATALGQIGDQQIAESLLLASDGNPDRFVEHAIIHSLISLKHPEPLLNALKHPTEDVRRNALIALDQMEGSPLKQEHVSPFLRDQSASLRTVAIWVLKHRPSWGNVVLAYLKELPASPERSEEERKTLTELMIAFAHDERLQQWMANKLTGPKVFEHEKWMFLDVMQQSALNDFPKEWTAGLKRLLKSGSPETQERVLAIVTARRINGFEEILTGSFMNSQGSASFRLKALRARMHSGPRFSPGEFGILLSFLDSTRVSALRQNAANILADASLSDEQMMVIARDVIPHTDPFLLPSLVNVFEGSDNKEAALALIDALSAAPERLELLPKSDLERIFESFPPDVKERSDLLMDAINQRDASRLSTLAGIERSLSPGDVGSGRKLFYGKALCSTCHAVAGNGADFGPDLTNIGEIRSQHDILEAIVYPSASFAREYETSTIVTRDGTYSGIVKAQYPEYLILETSPGVPVRVPNSDLTSIETRAVSMMPAGLHQQLDAGALSDLMAYLRSLPDGLGHLRTVDE